MSPWLDNPSPRKSSQSSGFRDNWRSVKWRTFGVILSLGITVILLGLCAAAYNRFEALYRQNQNAIDAGYWDNHSDNLTVTFHGWEDEEEYNLGTHSLRLHDQIRLLYRLNEAGGGRYHSPRWHVASMRTESKLEEIPLARQNIQPFDEEEWKRTHAEIDPMALIQAEQEHLDLLRMDRTVSDLLDRMSPADIKITSLSNASSTSDSTSSKSTSSRKKCKRQHQETKRDNLPTPAETTSLPPLPTNIGGVPTHLPEEPELPTPSTTSLPPLDPVPTHIGPQPPQPTGDVLFPRPAPTDLIPGGADGDPAKLPGFIQLPFKMISLLKRVVAKLSENEEVPAVIRRILVLVLHLLDKVQKDPEPTGPPTRPPIGKLPRPTDLPPLPPVPPVPSLPPLPTSSKRPILPPLPPLPPLPTDPDTRPPIGKRPRVPTPPPKWPPLPRPRPPGKGKGEWRDEDGDDDDDAAAAIATDEMVLPPPPPPTSGFVEVTRRRAGMGKQRQRRSDDGDDDDDDDGDVAGPGPTGNPGKSKQPLTKEQREYMNSAALVGVTEQVKKLHEKDPNDPLNAYITVPLCMRVFKRLAKHAERWLRKNPFVKAPWEGLEDGLGEDWDDIWDPLE